MSFSDFLKTNYSFIEARKNSSSFWDDECGDSLKNFKKNRSIPNLYNEQSIKYLYNSHGFRCDDFSYRTPLPILFLGCSVTEGYALPQEQTWSFLLLEKIRNATGITIPYWNLAIAGCGLDTQTHLLHSFRTNIAKPAFIFSYMPPFERIEAKMGSNTQYHFSRKFNNPKLDKFFVDENLRTGLLSKNIQYLDVLAESTPIYYAGWNYRHDVEDKILNSCANIKYFKASINWDRSDLARDSAHPGPEFHRQLAEVYWSKIKHHFEKING